MLFLGFFTSCLVMASLSVPEARAQSLEVAPGPHLLGQPTEIIVHTEPDTELVLHLFSRWRQGAQLDHAWARFRADGNRLDLATAKPIAGSYSGADAAGLFWSQQAAELGRLPAAVRAVVEAQAPKGADILLVVEQADKVAAVVPVTYVFDGFPGLRFEALTEGRLQGLLVEPVVGARAAPVLLLGGAEGGALRLRAAHLAKAGFPVLALAYFRQGDLPSCLGRIPVETVGGALEWLTEKYEDKVSVVGVSRGGELAVHAAARYGNRVGTLVTVNGAAWHMNGATGPFCAFEAPTWTLAGEDLPYMSRFSGLWTQIKFGFGQIDQASGIRAHLAALGAKADAFLLPYARLQMPALFIGGLLDTELPSAESLDRIESLAEGKSDLAFEIVRLPGAGHQIFANGWYPYGCHEGADLCQADFKAQKQVWAMVTAFLAKDHR